MLNATLMTFGARIVFRRVAPEEARWFFNVPDEGSGDVAPPAASAEPDDRVQIGPLDV